MEEGSFFVVYYTLSIILSCGIATFLIYNGVKNKVKKDYLTGMFFLLTSFTPIAIFTFGIAVIIGLFALLFQIGKLIECVYEFLIKENK